MILKEEFHHLNYIKKEELTGSMKGMRYLLKKGEIDGTERLLTAVWPGPLNYAKTPAERKAAKDFPFSQEGLAEAVDWMNAYYNENSGLFSAAGLRKP